MYQNINEQFSAASRQMADTAAQVNRLTLDNAEKVFGLQFANFQESMNATFAFWGELAEVRDIDGIKAIPAPQSVGAPDGLFQIPHIAWVNGSPLIDLGRQTKFLVFGVLDATPYFWMALTALIIVIFVERLVKKSRVGRMWEATREDEDAAEIMGVPTFKFKLLAFASGAFIGGLAGALFAAKAGYINPISFPANLSILFVAAVVIGGSGNRWGAIIGAVIVAYLPERFRELEDFRLLFFGAALVIIVSFRPQGLFPAYNAKRARRAARQAAKEANTEVKVV